jgi:hypothetical protein
MKRMMMAAVLAILAAAAQASGLRTPFGEVLVKNLKIGQTYSMYKLVNLPLRVVNTGDDETDLWVETIRVAPTEIKDGYEAIPSLDWVRVERGSFTIAANREAVTDLIVTIPDDAALMGRRFQADIWSHTHAARGSVAVGLQSHLLLQIDSTPPTEEELKKKFVDDTLANLDFTVLPVNNEIAAVPLGREVDLRKERKIAIKLINPNEKALNFRVRSIPAWESLLTVPSGFVDAPNAQWLKPEKDVVKVEGNSIGETNLKLSLPDDPKLSGAHLFFVVSIEVLEQRIPTRVFYRLMVDTVGRTPKDNTEGKTKGETK